MFASVCRRRLLRILQIPSAAGANPSRPNPRTPLLSHGYGYSSAALAGGPVPEPCAATTSYLISCGLSPAAAAAHKLRIRSTARADAVRALFRSYGFTDADIAEIIRRASVILNLGPDVLRPKLDLFVSLGVDPRRLAAVPSVFMRSLDKHLAPCIQFFRDVIGSDEDVCAAISRAPRALRLGNLEKSMRPVVDTLRRLGLTDKSISKLLVMEMGVLTLSPDRVSQIFEDLKALGLGVMDTGFLYGIRAFCRLSRENCLRKLALYRSFGVSEDELHKAFKMQPAILNFSSETIEKKLQYFLDELKLELSDVMEKPVLMTYSLEKCIIPRCAVLSVLMREGKIDPNINLRAALIGSAEMFSKRFVLRLNPAPRTLFEHRTRPVPHSHRTRQVGMFASVCRRRLLRLLQIPSAAIANPSRPNPRIPLLSHGHGYSSAAIAGGPVPEPCAATTSYLISCGLSPAAAAAHKLRIRSAARADAVRALFRSYGFTDADIAEIIRRASVILNLGPDILRPKLDLFASLGVDPRRLAATPSLFTRSLDKHLVPCIQFFRGVIGTDEDVCTAISRAPRALRLGNLEKHMRPVVDTLRRHGLTDKFISKLLVMEMGVLTLSPDRVSQIFMDLRALGLGVMDTGFLCGIRTFCRLSRETCLRKLALYRSFGVSEDELRKAFKTQPAILHGSSETIEKKLRFFMDELKLEPSDVIGKPVLMTYSLEKCIIPRCAVLSVLMREGKIDPNINLRAALIGSAETFSKRFVLRYAHDVPDVLKAFEGKITFEGFRDRDALRAKINIPCGIQNQ
ncbi:hypothetical protein U9M48_026884 [Paspalum notatum var. saurae]|uniref:Uncharacterized protein n=1 Tax=Paspalum notatum var. saurae TaxID=547442 RepID=A0AAQ3WZC6_PASNO